MASGLQQLKPAASWRSAPQTGGLFLSRFLTDSDSSGAKSKSLHTPSIDPLRCSLPHGVLSASADSTPALQPEQHSYLAPRSGAVSLRWGMGLAGYLWLQVIGYWRPGPAPSPPQARGRRVSSSRCSASSLAVCLFLVRPPACVHGHRRHRGALPFPRSSAEERDRGRLLPVPLPGVWRARGAHRRPGHGGRSRGSRHAGEAAPRARGREGRAETKPQKGGTARGDRRTPFPLHTKAAWSVWLIEIGASGKPAGQPGVPGPTSPLGPCPILPSEGITVFNPGRMGGGGDTDGAAALTELGSDEV